MSTLYWCVSKTIYKQQYFMVAIVCTVFVMMLLALSHWMIRPDRYTMTWLIYLMNGLSNLNKTYKGVFNSLAPNDDPVRFSSSKVEGQGHSRPSRWRRRPHRCWGVEVHLLVWEITEILTRKRYRIQTWLQWKTNRKSNVDYRMTSIQVTLNDLKWLFFCGLKPFYLPTPR